MARYVASCTSRASSVVSRGCGFTFSSVPIDAGGHDAPRRPGVPARAPRAPIPATSRITRPVSVSSALARHGSDLTRLQHDLLSVTIGEFRDDAQAQAQQATRHPRFDLGDVDPFRREIGDQLRILGQPGVDRTQIGGAAHLPTGRKCRRRAGGLNFAAPGRTRRSAPRRSRAPGSVGRRSC